MKRTYKKLTKQQITEIKARVRSGERNKDICSHMGVSSKVVGYWAAKTRTRKRKELTVSVHPDTRALSELVMNCGGLSSDKKLKILKELL